MTDIYDFVFSQRLADENLKKNRNKVKKSEIMKT